MARGIYFDRIDNIIAARKSALAGKVKQDIAMLGLVFLVAVAIALLVAYHFSRQLQAIFDRYRHNQEENYAKLETLHKALKQQSRTDSLTGVFNRGYFNRQLERETSRAKRYGTPLSLILLDLDSFKTINDTFGHLVGDTVLQILATLIKNNIRQSDTLARWGGEEFAILTPGIGVEETALFAEKLRKLSEEKNFQVNIAVTCSFGVTAYQPHENVTAFLQRADDALYSAKQQGKNRCVIR